MSAKRKIRIALAALLFAACFVAQVAPALAQCAMCKTALSNSPDAARLAEKFNYAVLVLLIPPVLLFCGIFVAAYRFSKAPGEEGEARGVRGLLSKLGARLRRRKRHRREAGDALV